MQKNIFLNADLCAQHIRKGADYLLFLLNRLMTQKESLNRHLSCPDLDQVQWASQFTSGVGKLSPTPLQSYARR